MNRCFTSFFARLLPGLLLGLVALLVGCIDDSSQSANDVVRTVPVDFTGVYSNSNGDFVSQNSGEPVTLLNLNQSGAQLDAFDNNGQIYRGNISRVASDNSASFNLEGTTTEGNRVVIDGTLSGSGTSGEISGTWIESDLFAVLSGSATISDSTQPTNTTGNTSLAISPAGNQTLTVGQQRTFSASGGGTGASYQWTVSNQSIGRITTQSGASATYAPISAGTQTLTVTSGGSTESVTITQSGASNTAANNSINNLGLGVR